MKVKVQTPSRRGWVLSILAAAVALSLPWVLDAHVHHGFWDSVPGWWAWYGAAGCAAIVIVSKLLGKAFLQKSENFYGEEDSDA